MAKKKHTKSKIRIYSEYIPFIFLYKIILLLPLSVGYWISSFLFKLLFIVDRRHRRRTIEHILHSCIVDNRPDAIKLANASMTEFSKLLVEIFKMNQLYDMKKIYTVGHPEGVKAMLGEDNKGGEQVIIITAHYGNWEVAGTAISDCAQRPMTSLMRPFANPKIGNLIVNHRGSSVHELVDKQDGIRPILRALANGRNISVLIDQHAAGNEGVVCDFFGHPAKVHMTPALLHLKTGIPILPELTRRLPGNNFEFEVITAEPIRYQPTGDKQYDVQQITQQCISALEKLIRQYPDQWLWTPRHWLDLNRRGAENYKDWKSDLPTE